MVCKIKTLGSCHGGDTTLSGGGVDNVKKLFPDADVSERPLFDSIASEPAKLSGTKLKLWSLRRAMHRHPLYGEPSLGGQEWAYHGPWEVYGSFEFEEAENIDNEATTEGYQKTGEGTAFIARAEIEKVGAPNPKVGDVISLWDEPPFESQYMYWDVVGSDESGHIMTTNQFVQWKLKLKHRTKFKPRRKVEGETT